MSLKSNISLLFYFVILLRTYKFYNNIWFTKSYVNMLKGILFYILLFWNAQRVFEMLKGYFGLKKVKLRGILKAQSVFCFACSFFYFSKGILKAQRVFWNAQRVFWCAERVFCPEIFLKITWNKTFQIMFV